MIPLALAAPVTTATEAADRHRARVANGFLRMVANLQRGIRASDDFSTIPDHLADVFRGSGLGPKERSFEDDLRVVFEAGAEAGMYRLRRVRVAKATTAPPIPATSVTAAMSFTLLNPSAVSFLQGYSFELITGLTAIMRESIRDVLTQAFRDGLPVAAQARLIRQYIGLTPAQIRAVENYRRLLESGDPGALRETMGRALRDARYDRTIERTVTEGARLTRQQINAMVDRYVSRQLKYRAEMIARTETIRAANAGQIEAWRQAQQQGYLATTVRQKWIYTNDERTCTVCPQIAEMNPVGVPIGGVFRAPGGAVKQPPDPHPRCRCALGLLFVE